MHRQLQADLLQQLLQGQSKQPQAAQAQNNQLLELLNKKRNNEVQGDAASEKTQQNLNLLQQLQAQSQSSKAQFANQKVQGDQKLTAWQLHRNREKEGESQITSKTGAEIKALQQKIQLLKREVAVEEETKRNLTTQATALKLQEDSVCQELEATNAAAALNAEESARLALGDTGTPLDAMLKEQKVMLEKLKCACEERDKELAQEENLVYQSLYLHPPAEKLLVAELKHRYPDCKVPRNLRSVRSHIYDEGATVPCPEPTFSDGADVILLSDQRIGEATLLDGCKYTAKLVHLTSCNGRSDHPVDKLQLVGAKLLESSKHTFYGGSWCFGKDGGDPTSLETLTSVVKRHLLAQSGVDLGSVPLTRFCTFNYEKEIVEYLIPDPGRMKSVTFKPMAKLDSRQLAREGDLEMGGKGRSWKGKAGSRGPSEEEIIARVITVPHAVGLRDVLDMGCDQDGPSITWELAITARLMADRLRRTAGHRMKAILKNLGRKRKAVPETPLHLDSKAPTPPEGSVFSSSKRVKTSKVTVDPIMLRGYKFFDRPDKNGTRAETVSKNLLLSNLTSLGSSATLQELNELLTSAGFADGSSTCYYLDMCSTMKTDTAYEKGALVPIDLSL